MCGKIQVLRRWVQSVGEKGQEIMSVTQRGLAINEGDIILETILKDFTGLLVRHYKHVVCIGK